MPQRAAQQHVRHATRGVGWHVARQQIRGELRVGSYLTRVAKSDDRGDPRELGEAPRVVERAEQSPVEEHDRRTRWVQLRNEGKLREAAHFDRFVAA